MENRVFFPQSVLDEWVVDGAVDMQADSLTILSEGRSYELVEAVHVVREVSGIVDSNDLVGRVKGRAYLEQLGAEIVETSMLLGEAAYDVEAGWLGVPAGTFEEHEESAAREPARGGRISVPPKSDEELLAAFLAKSL
jgi:hypothetical protein